MEILYQDKQIVVIVKPVGMDSEHEVPQALGGEIFPIHRLDKNVGGVMIYARTKQSAATLSKAVQEGTMVKEYVALVHGVPPESGDWTDFLWKDSSKNKVFVVKKESSAGVSTQEPWGAIIGADSAAHRAESSDSGTVFVPRISVGW